MLKDKITAKKESGLNMKKGVQRWTGWCRCEGRSRVKY